MMPEDSVYGVWPQSGEIDIMEARGNNYSYPGGRDVYSTTLHWGNMIQINVSFITNRLIGPSPDTDAFWRTTSQKALRRTDYSEAFHTFGVEWTEKYLFFYVDTRLQEVLFVSFDTQDFWERGNFATMGDSSEFLENPWSQTDSKSAPFDQEFYLILNVAVGSRNGWFPYVSLSSFTSFYCAIY
jgi:beta-glucanase (GH16 family)